MANCGIHAYIHPRTVSCAIGSPSAGAGPLKSKPREGHKYGYQSRGSAAFLETRVSILISNLVAWVMWPRSLSHVSFNWPLHPGHHPALTWFASLSVGVCGQHSPQGGWNPRARARWFCAWVGSSGPSFGWDPSLHGDGGSHACGLSTACLNPPLVPLPGADRFLGRYLLVTIILYAGPGPCGLWGFSYVRGRGPTGPLSLLLQFIHMVSLMFCLRPCSVVSRERTFGIGPFLARPSLGPGAFCVQILDPPTCSGSRAVCFCCPLPSLAH